MVTMEVAKTIRKQAFFFKKKNIEMSQITMSKFILSTEKTLLVAFVHQKMFF